jgi:hypothetical protein
LLLATFIVAVLFLLLLFVFFAFALGAVDVVMLEF